MATTSAGILLYRRIGPHLEVLAVHPGGPFWARKDLGAWSIPKGEYAAHEDAFTGARREFLEELGTEVPPGDARPLGEVRQKGGKVVTAWALEGNLDVTVVASNTFEMEWPPRSGKLQEFPEVDRAEWFDIATARTKLIAAQVEFLDRLDEAFTWAR